VGDVPIQMVGDEGWLMTSGGWTGRQGRDDRVDGLNGSTFREHG
jgi:hypothetical protein